MYIRPEHVFADRLKKKFKRFYTTAYHRFYMDEIWMFVTKKVIFRCVSTPFAWWDRHVIDQFYNFIAWGTFATSEEVQEIQSGHVQKYAIWFLAGSIVLTLLLLI